LNKSKNFYNGSAMPIAQPSSHLPANSASRLTHPLVLWSACVAFVVYGSLVPLDFQSLPLDRAWVLFSQMPTLQVDVEGRADWIANGVLYVPVGFLTLSLFASRGNILVRLPTIAVAALFCSVLAVAVEFAQLFFPPRTVSLNDVVAEWLGSLVGLTLAVLWARRFRRFSLAPMVDSTQVGQYVTMAYVIAYLILSLFPYDFLLSDRELDQKINSASWGWFLAAKSLSGGSVALLVKLVAEALVVLPFGFVLGQRSAGRQGFSRGFVLGAILGLIVESAQWFVFSGISQGVSVLTRAIGVGVGASLWRRDWNAATLRALLRPMAPGIGLVYVVALPVINGWFSRHWGNAELALRKLENIRFVPFYYHYYTSEAVALVSVISVCLMYAPIGLLAWAVRASPGTAAVAAGLAACVVEVGKLFIDGARPDPTDLLIASLSSWGVTVLAQRLTGASTRQESRPRGETAGATYRQSGSHSDPYDVSQSSPARPDREPPVVVTSPEMVPGVWRMPSVSGYVGLCVVVGLVAWTVATFPMFPVLLGTALAGYGAMVWRRPTFAVAAIPAALPLLDLAPWTGRFFFDEFDLLVLVSLAVGYVRAPAASGKYISDTVFLAVTSLVGLSFLVGAVRGVLPPQVPDANSFTNYHSSYNALRVAKGVLWAFLLYGLLYRLSAAGQDVRRFFVWGMVAGLAGTVTVVVWERFVFSGLFNFANDYRVTGPFSQAHIGSAYIEGFLTAATPFLSLWFVQSRRRTIRLAAMVLLLGTTYAMMVTFSRSGYVAYFITLAMVFLIFAIPSVRRHGASIRRTLSLVVGVLLVLAVTVPVVKGRFATERLSQIDSDIHLRLSHWHDAMGMRSNGLVASVLGEGVGRFPITHYWHSTEEVRAASYSLEIDGAMSHLRIGAGSALYVEQFVAVRPHERYVLALDVRASQPNAMVKVWLCEKWLLTSYDCFSQLIEIGTNAGLWRRHEVVVDSNELGRGSWYGRRPVKLAISNPNDSSAIDVRNVRLESMDRRDLVVNGDFSHGLDRWFFSVDNYWPWHIESLPLVILFDLGWMGGISVTLLVALALWRSFGGVMRGDLAAGAGLAALTGFLAVGVLNSLIDTPRFLMLFLLLLWLASTSVPRSCVGGGRSQSCKSYR
jgi:VanZ family protein